MGNRENHGAGGLTMQLQRSADPRGLRGLRLAFGLGRFGPQGGFGGTLDPPGRRRPRVGAASAARRAGRFSRVNRPLAHRVT